MKTKPRAFSFLRVGIILISLLVALSTVAGAVYFEKKYLVRQVEGEEILCDSYVVQKNDYVTLLLKQRGDIADKDFPRFLRLFGALNPTVKDINTIYPNQRILIPLKALAPDSVEGQSTGTVTIPLITITNLPETIEQHSEEYRVQYGEWVAKLISQRFGNEGTETFRQGMQLFKRLNPDIKDINIIRAGQIVRLPDPAIQNSPVYDALFDPTGELVEAAQEPVETAEAIAEPPVEPEPIVESVLAPKPEPEAMPEESGPKKAASGSDTADEEGAKGEAEPPSGKIALPIPLDLPGFADQSAFKKAVAILDAELLNSGEYFFPRHGQKDLRLILAETPLMIFDGGVKLLFTKGDWLSGPDQKLIETHWPGTRIVRYDMRTELRELLQTIIPLIDPDGYENRLDINDRGVSINVRGQYIYDAPGHPGKICLNIIDNPDMRVPAPICAYLKTRGITVRDWIDGDSPPEATAENASDFMSFQAPEILHVAGHSAPLFVRLLSTSLGYSYQEGIEISFPYAGFQINALTNMLAFGPDDEVLLDFGDLGGDAIESIQNTGFRIVQLDGNANSQALLTTLSELMPADFITDPIFWTAHRPRLYNPSFQVPGFLISATHGDRVQQVLVTDIALPERIASYLEESGIRLMRVLN